MWWGLVGGLDNVLGVYWVGVCDMGGGGLCEREKEKELIGA